MKALTQAQIDHICEQWDGLEYAGRFGHYLPIDIGAAVRAELAKLDSNDNAPQRIELSEADIDAIWESMPGGPSAWMRNFGYQQFAAKLLEATKANAAFRKVGITNPMPGSGNGFTMAAFHAVDVPNGSALYIIPEES